MWEGDRTFAWGGGALGTVIREASRAASGGLQRRGSGISLWNSECRGRGGGSNEAGLVGDREGHARGQQITWD